MFFFRSGISLPTSPSVSSRHVAEQMRKALCRACAKPRPIGSVNSFVEDKNWQQKITHRAHTTCPWSLVFAHPKGPQRKCQNPDLIKSKERPRAARQLANQGVSRSGDFSSLQPGSTRHKGNPPMESLPVVARSKCTNFSSTNCYHLAWG